MSQELAGPTQIFKTIFHNLDDETLQKLKQVATAHEYEPDTILCKQGEVEDTFYVIVEGDVVVSQQLEDGEIRVLGACGPSQYFGEMGLLDNTPRIATCTAVAPTKVLQITKKEFNQLVDNSPAIAYSLMYRLLENLRANDALAIQELLEKNIALGQAYEELQVAQLALIKRERLERELEIVAEVQQSLLPDDLPTFDDYEFASYLKLERRAGGDFYDVIELDDEHLGVLLGDVADKGVHASLFMAVTRTLFLAESKRSLSPLAVTKAVHRGMLDVSSTNDMFVMAFYGVLHRPTGTLTYVIAGQQQPLWLRPNLPIQDVEGHGSFLGMMDSLEIQEHRIQLQPGDYLVLLSNGVIDSVNTDGQQYGKERLRQTMQTVDPNTAEELLQTIVADITTWCGDAAPTDDLALLVVAAR